MKKRISYTLLRFFLIVLACSILTCEKDESFTQISKIAIRDVGNKLLLSNQDSISLILPVIKIEKKKYQLAFETQLTFEPNNLVSIVKESFDKANLPSNYQVEVIQCNDNEVAYSYKINNNNEVKSIIPCAGRVLPLNCYYIEVKFTNNKIDFSINYLPILASVVLLFGIVYRYQKKRKPEIEEVSFSKIGSYKFYKDQNKLIKDAVEIKLSVKECELMAMLSANQNKVVKREILVKEIWENNGVYVDRSLDTFISKLRKKFKDDDSINIVNVHGVGYKLEVN